MDTAGPERLCRLIAAFSGAIGAERFRTWFAPPTELRLIDNRIEVLVSNPFTGSWISSNFLPALLDAAREVVAADATVDILVRGVNGDGAATAALGPTSAARPHNGKPARIAARAEARPPLRGDLCEFVVGPCNDLAYAAAANVARTPGGAFKHLVLHGGCGLGKTHLLQGICNGLRCERPAVTWAYVSGEEFTNEFIYALKSNRVEAFRARFRAADVLVIDDLHFLANKRSTQEEFLHTFNTIDTGGKTVVLSTDRHPRQISELSPALQSRLAAAVIVEVQPPDLPTRREILRRRAARMSVVLMEDALEYVARHVLRNVRELEGALFKLAAYAALTKEPIGLDMARRVLCDYVTHSRPPEIEEIASAVAEFFEVSRELIESSSRDRAATQARGVVMYLARRLTPLSYPEIGRRLGHKNHSTVLMAVRRVENHLQGDGAVAWKTSAGPRELPLRRALDDLERRLGWSRAPSA